MTILTEEYPNFWAPKSRISQTRHTTHSSTPDRQLENQRYVHLTSSAYTYPPPPHSYNHRPPHKRDTWPTDTNQPKPPCNKPTYDNHTLPPRHWK